MSTTFAYLRHPLHVWFGVNAVALSLVSLVALFVPSVSYERMMLSLIASAVCAIAANELREAD